MDNNRRALEQSEIHTDAFKKRGKLFF